MAGHFCFSLVHVGHRPDLSNRLSCYLWLHKTNILRDVEAKRPYNAENIRSRRNPDEFYHLFAHQSSGNDPGEPKNQQKILNISWKTTKITQTQIKIQSIYPRTCPPPRWTAWETRPIKPILPPPYTRSSLLATFTQHPKTKKIFRKHAQENKQKKWVRSGESVPALALIQRRHLCNSFSCQCCFHRRLRHSWIWNTQPSPPWLRRTLGGELLGIQTLRSSRYIERKDCGWGKPQPGPTSFLTRRTRKNITSMHYICIYRKTPQIIGRLLF